MHSLGNILTGIGAFLLLGNLWTEFTKRNLDQLYICIFVGIPSLGGMIVLSLSRVDPFANLWGPHVWWKLIPAALIFALFWPIALGVLQHVKNKKERWLAYAWGLLVFGSLLSFVLVDWMRYPASADISPDAYKIFPWLSLHPSLAIHHLYANATYLGAWELMGASLIVGKPLAKRLAAILGSNRNAVLLNTVLLVVGVVTQVATK